MLEQSRGVCWDLDHTLVGVFSATDRHAASNPPARPGIARTLERLAGHGYRHFVTTGGTRDYAERVLAATGIRQYFAGIFEGAEIDAGAGKRYRPVARLLGLTDAQAQQCLITTGDLVYDQPADIGGMVFIHQPNGFRMDGSVVEGVIGWLEAAGAGDLHAGFQACLALPEYVAPWLPAGVTLRLDLRSPHHPRRMPRLEEIMIPTVCLLPGEANGLV